MSDTVDCSKAQFGPLHPDCLPWEPPEDDPPVVEEEPYVATKRATVNEVAQPVEYRLKNTAAKNSVVPMIYGRDKIGAAVIAATLEGGSEEWTHLVLGVAWCLGEVDAIEKVYINETSVNDASAYFDYYVSCTNYLGTPTQGVDPILANAISGYADDCVFHTPSGDDVGVCYSVIRIHPDADIGFPDVTALIRGFKVYDPREALHDPDDRTTWEWSNNPALTLADFLQSDVYGAGRDVDWSTVSTLADRNDKDIDKFSTTVMRTLNLTMSKASKTETWVETLRNYAACFIVNSDDGIKLTPDAVTSTVASVTFSDMVDGSFSAKRTDLLDSPTALIVKYTETSTDTFQWKDEQVEVVAAGVSAGTMPRLESVVDLPGINSYQQALREATIRFNHFYYEDLAITFDAFDSAVRYMKGDVIHVNHPLGIDQRIRITDMKSKDPGRWTIQGREYQPAVYSSAFSPERIKPDTDWPSPGEIPALTGLAFEEELYQLQTGVWASRFIITWDAPFSYPYALMYTVTVKTDRYDIQRAWQETTLTEEIITGPLQENMTYSIEVFGHTATGFTGPTTTLDGCLAVGKTAIPTDITEIDGYELGGEVRLFWSPSYDLDIYRYVVKYGAVGADWDDMTEIDRVDALRIVINDIQQGEWDFAVKAVDSIAQFAENEARITLTVTLDTGAYLAASTDFTTASATVSNIHVFEKGRASTHEHVVTKDSQSMASAFPNALNTYNDPICCHHASVEAYWQSDTWDIGTPVVGSFRITYSSGFSHVSTLGSTIDVSATMDLSQDASTWEGYYPMQHKQQAQYARFRCDSHGTGTMYFTIPYVRARVDVVPREENGEVATFPQKTSVWFDGINDYAEVSNSSAVNIASAGYTAKTLEVTFIPETQLSTIGIIYEHGGGNAGINMYISDTSVLYAGVWTDAATKKMFCSKAGIKAGSQYHASLRFGVGANDSSARLAVNGVSCDSTAFNAVNGIDSNEGSICIAAARYNTRTHIDYVNAPQNSSVGFFRGKIFRIIQYNRRVTDEEVVIHAAEDESGDTSYIQKYIFDEGGGTEIRDDSSTTSDASMVGATWASASHGKVVTTENDYFAAQSVALTPLAVAARHCTADNFVFGDKGSFVVYAFDTNATQASTNVAWSFKGV